VVVGIFSILYLVGHSPQEMIALNDLKAIKKAAMHMHQTASLSIISPN
jgi:hypothetical protein